MGRLFWFTVGAGATAYAVVKARGYAHRSNPEALGRRGTGTAAGITGSVRDFATRVRAASAEREAELRGTLGLSD